MIILNESRGVTLADRAAEAHSLRARLRGLIGRAGLESGEALVIRPCTSIHSFFMRFAFDAAFFAADGRVLHVIHGMKPYRLSRYVPRAAGVIELPNGALLASGTAPGDALRFS